MNRDVSKNLIYDFVSSGFKSSSSTSLLVLFLVLLVSLLSLFGSFFLFIYIFV